MHSFKIGDEVEHLKKHLAGRVMGVAEDKVKVIFAYVKSPKGEPNTLVEDCKPSELRRLS